MGIPEVENPPQSVQKSLHKKISLKNGYTMESNSKLKEQTLF